MSADDPWAFDEDEVNAFLAGQRKVDAEAAELLRGACAHTLEAGPPQPALSAAAGVLREGCDSDDERFSYFTHACGLNKRKRISEDDTALWLSAVEATISPASDPGSEPEEQAVVAALLHADWFGMIVGLCRRGVGAKFTAGHALRDIESTPEIDDDSDDIGDDKMMIQVAAAILAPRWQLLGVLDDEKCLTELGHWGLPTALYRVWTGAAAPE